MSKKDFIVGLDIGTTKTCCLVAEVSDAGTPHPVIDIVGIGTAISTGLRKGVVINIDATVESIRKAVDEAQLMAGVKVSTVYAGIAGSHIQSFNSSGVVAVKDKEIRSVDIQRVLDAAKAVAMPADREIIHVIPQEYLIDEQDGIRDPVGMNGVRLEARVHIVTAASSAVQNIVKCANRAGLNVSEVCLEPIASGEAVLSADEKELGVALIDIGGGTTDLAVFREGSVIHTAVLPIGGQHITNDIAVGMRTPQSEAERLKIRSGCALAALVGDEDAIEVPGVGGRKSRSVPRKLLAEIIEPRMEEIFSLAQKELMRSGFYDLLSAGIVVTGGTAQIEGITELAERIFDIPAKRGAPLAMGGLFNGIRSPQFATAAGLIFYGASRISRGQKMARLSGKDFVLYDRLSGTVRSWMKDLF